MDRRDIRSDLPRFSSFSTRLGASLRGGASLASLLTRNVGKALGAGQRSRSEAVERLEERTLLAGNSFGTATVLAASDGSGRLFSADAIASASEADFYRFTLQPNHFAGILADTANQSPASTLNTRVEVYNSTQQLISSSTNNGTVTSGFLSDGWVGAVNTGSTAQDFFVVVRSEGVTTGNYTVRVRADNVDFDIGGETPELGVNREFGSPTPDFTVQPAVLPVPVLGQLGGTNATLAQRVRQDDVIYRWRVPNDPKWANLVTINAQALASAPQNRRLDTRLEVYNTSGALVTFDAEAGRLNDAFATFVAVPGQTYFIRVRSDEVRNTNIEFATGPFYILIDGIATDLGDPNQVTDPLDPITNRAQDNGFLFALYDEPTNTPSPDFNGGQSDAPIFHTASYQFVASGSGLAIITAIPEPSPFANPKVTDPALTIYDDTGTQIAFNNNLVGLDAEVRVQLLGGRRYYIVLDGFAVGNGIFYQINVEANHIFETNGVDDHPNTPVLPTTPTDQDTANFNRGWSIATALPWGDPFLTLDGNGNPIRDRGLRVTSTGSGRIFNGGDTDLFQFTPPTDMLGTHNGNNDETGNSLFIGGRYEVSDPGSRFPVTSRNISTWDAGDFWYVGQQNFDATSGATFGMQDNPDTAATPDAEIYVMYDWTPTAPNGTTELARRLVVGGDFLLVLPNPQDPTTPIQIKNFAIWQFAGGVWGWDTVNIPALPSGDLGVNGPVRALTRFDPDNDFSQDLDALYVGGQFAAAGTAVANNLVRFRLDSGFQAVPGVALAPNQAIFALATYDAPDPGSARAAQTGPPALDEVLDPPNLPLSLYFGGAIANGVKGFDGAAVFELAVGEKPIGSALPNLVPGVNRTAGQEVVRSLTTFTFDPDGTGDRAPREVLAVGGLFNEAGGAAAQNFAIWGEVDEDPIASDSQAPDYYPKLLWRAPIGADGGAGVFTMKAWQRPRLNNEADPAPLILALGGEFDGFIKGWDGADGVEATIPGFQGLGIADGPVYAIEVSAVRGTSGNSLTRDTQEPGIRENLDSGDAQTTLYLGGAFTQYQQNAFAAPIAASRVVNIVAGTGAQALDDFLAPVALAGGVDRLDPANQTASSVFALTSFDDGNPNEWDRHDRISTRLQVVVTPTADAFINLRVRVYDSRFTLVYDFGRPGSESIDPDNPGGDPAGMIDTSLLGRDTQSVRSDQFRGITVWGGETYYLEVLDPRGGFGRYDLTITTDAGPQPVLLDVANQTTAPGSLIPDPTGFVGDINLTFAQEEGFSGGELLGDGQGGVRNLFPNELGKRSGDDDITAGDVGSAFDTTAVGGLVPAGNQRMIRRITPSTGTAIAVGTDLGVISSINDIDVYSFRATYTGTAEIRINTANYLDQYGETTLAFPNDEETTASNFVGLPTTNPLASASDPTRRSSRLDAVVRVLRNDLSQISYSDDSAVIRPNTLSALDRRFVGGQGQATGYPIGIAPDAPTGMVPYSFRKTDPRVVFPIEQNRVYYIQVESGQRYRNGRPEEVVDRELNPAGEIEWREATGGYNLVVNQMPDFQNLLGFSDIVNGQRVTDDHYDFVSVRGSDLDFTPVGNPATFQPAVGGYATPIAIGEDPSDAATNGRGSITGVIVNTPSKPRDIDVFRFAVPASGRATIRLTRPQSSGLDARFNVYRENATNPTQALLISGGSVQSDGSVVFVADNAVQGEEYIIEVFAQGPTEGAYQLDVTTQPFVDDHASASKWSSATDVPLIDFRGSGTASGRIEVPGDTDIFKFAVTDWDRATITVQPIDATLSPRVTVYQVNETAQLFPFYQRIGEGVGSPATTIVTVTPDRSAINPVRSYDFYYIVVDGVNPRADSGRYNLLINFTPTDDFPDGDTNADSVFDVGEFPIASPFTLDSNNGTGSFAGTIEVDSDSDLFTFSVPATGNVSVTVTRPAGSTLRPRITLLRSDATIITQVQAADSFTFTSLVAATTLPRNTQVFVVVDGLAITGSAPAAGRTGQYTVSVQAPPQDDHANATEWSIATPITISTGSGRGQIGSDAGSPLNPRINYIGDTDLFSFTVIRAGNQTVTVTPLTSTLGLIAPRLQIFISTNLTTPIADVSASSAGSNASFTITGATLGAQYFILVNAQTGVTGASGQGDFRVAIIGPVPVNPQPQDPAEVDFNTPTTIVINSRTGDGSLVRTLNSQTPEINPADDRDLYNFTVASAGRVFVRLSRPSGSLLTATLQVFRRNTDNTFTEIPVVIDNRSGSIAYTEFGSAANVDYFVIVDGLGPSIGAYNLEVNTQPLVNRLVYPEGFSGDNVFEFIPLVNTNPFPITYTLTLYYENDQIINGVTTSTSSVTRTISAEARDGITVWQPTGNPAAPFYSDIRDSQNRPLVARNVAFSMVLEWQVPTVNPLNGSPIDPLSIQPLGATSSHYDFGSSTGDALTDKVTPTWTFPRIERQDGSALNFILFWNPNNFAVQVTLTAYLPDGTVRVLPEVSTVQARRRAGFGIFGLPSLAGINGIFSVTLNSAPVNSADAATFEGVVASLTAYRTGGGNDSAYGIIGDAEGGSTRGAINRVTNFANGTGSTSEITFFNSSTQPASVTLTGRYVRTDIPGFARTIQVGAGRSVTLNGSQLGLQVGQAAGISYVSNVPLSVQAYQQQRGDADSATPSYSAASRYYFGDAFINIDRAGVQYFETLSFYNPATSDITVSVVLTFADRVTGRTNSTGSESAESTIFVTIPAGGFSELRLHENQAILGNRRFDNNPGLYYGIEVLGASPFTVAMEHYDLFLGGGWAANGVPFGIATPLSQIN
jgi:hypothetical protein